MTLQQIEAALDAGKLWALTGMGKFYRAHRNGQTKTWKTRPGEFRIPVKVCFRSCGYVKHDNLSFFQIREEA